ncbi:Eukaryotic rRNA processing [Sesbania bispinosa]|nr:Eukaryotic rRNA processing [Sesbania bispinosa]
MGLPFPRPIDYYAGRVKTNNNMEKVKGWIAIRKEAKLEAEERRKVKEGKNLAKEIQEKRPSKKKEEIESVKK